MSGHRIRRPVASHVSIRRRVLPARGRGDRCRRDEDCGRGQGVEVVSQHRLPFIYARPPDDGFTSARPADTI
jgi:hypothetical protein